MNTLTLSVDNSSFDSAGITKDCQDAICEFIWNALEASANRVDIVIHGGDMSEAGEIIISDNGSGISYDNLQDTFGAFLSSQKRNQRIRIKTQTNKGKGRFSYLAFAPLATWQTTYQSEGHRYSYRIQLSATNKTNIGRTEKAESSDISTGTIVTIPITESKTYSELQFPRIKNKLLQEFAWYLYLHKDRQIVITYCGEKLQYNDYINTELSREYTIKINNYSFMISVIAWNNRIDNSSKIYYVDKDGGICGAENTHFNKNAANFFHGAFARSSYFSEAPILTGADDDAALIEYSQGQRDIMRQLKKEISTALDSVLREHLLRRADEYLKEEKTIKALPSFSTDAMGEAKKTISNEWRVNYIAWNQEFFIVLKSNKLRPYLALLLFFLTQTSEKIYYRLLNKSLICPLNNEQNLLRC